MTASVLSGYWAKAHHRALGSATDQTARLAIALGAIRSIIRVVDRTIPPLTVDWSSVDDHETYGPQSKSYTDLRGGHIRLNPLAILDASLSPGEALDVAVGFGLHEASHSQESRSRYEHLLKKEMHPNGKGLWEVPAFAPMKIAAYLWNLVEDVRIEEATSRNWPGFRAYFPKVLRWMWVQMRKRRELPTEYGTKVEDRLRTVFLACRYPAQAAKLFPEDEASRAEVAWWQAWQADYLAERADTPTTIRRGLDHLATGEAAKELEQMAQAERKERESGEKLRAQLERLIREGATEWGACVTEDGEVVPLDRETTEQVRQLVAEGLIEHQTVVTVEGADPVPVRVRKPTETPSSKRSYVGRPNAEAEALRAALVFRSSAPQHDEKLLRQGAIDDDELYRWGMGDDRVFSQRVIEAKPDVFMGLLVDLSGSMYGEKLRIAQRLAQLFVWALHDQEGVETGVWGHTADVAEADSAEVYRLWSKGDPMSRLGLIADLPHANNADGYALEYVVSQVEQAEQPQKVVVVLSDGLPSAHAYGSRSAQHHIRAVCRWAAQRGVRVIQVAIDPHGQRPSDQAAMYGGENVVLFRDYAALPRQMAAILGRFA